jgi:aminopeptidase N
MLRKMIGDDEWWHALNHYLTKYAHQPVDTEQFRRAVEETTGQPLDWFFDEWVYKMGHPVFNVSENYDAQAKTLTLDVRQEQQPDQTSAYPQTRYFRAPVEIEIGTTAGARVERIELAPQAEQTFAFKVASKPLLVNFDYQSTLIKELHFAKPVDELVYQLAHDEDVTGRVWAMGQLRARLRRTDTTEAEQQRIADALAAAVTTDKFWGVRADAAGALRGLQGARVRQSLGAATKDAKAQVRAQAIAALGDASDQNLAALFQQALADQSYAVVSAAAEALGKTKAPGAYDALMKLLATPSWHERTQAAALDGLTELGDKRALEVAFRYATPEHSTEARRSALYLLGATGKGDPRVVPLLIQTLRDAFANSDFTLGYAAGETIYALDDEEGLKALRGMLAIVNTLVSNADLQAFTLQVEARLRQKQETQQKQSKP